MIIPNPWLTNLLQKNLRKYIFENSSVNEIVHFKQSVFHKVTVDTEVVILTKEKQESNLPRITVVEKGKLLLEDEHQIITHKQKEWIESNGDIVNIFQSETDKKLFKKILLNSDYLETYFSINVGIKPYQVGKGKPKQVKKTVEERVFDSETKLDKYYRKYLRGSDINRYVTAPLKERYLKYGEWLAEPRPAANFDAPVKIFMRQTGDSLIATIDENQYLCLNNMHVLVPFEKVNAKYFLGIINSSLLNWYYQTLNPEKGEALAEVKKSNVAKLPIKQLDKSQKSLHNEIVHLVETMLQLQKEKQQTTLPDKLDQLKTRIEYTDEKINKLVFELYGLGEEERRIVEASTNL
jgi:hypothetical protein